MSSLISTRGLRVDYDGQTAVDGIDLDVDAGQIYGLVGPNGAGKTSTIRALAGLLDPTAGEIRLAGADLRMHPENAWAQLGYMPDFPPVYENLKVWEYLDAFGAAYKIPKPIRRARIEHWLERVSLTGKRDAFIRELSRGMRQRLGFAKSLLHEPKVLLLDEPASGLDPISRVELREILKDLGQKGTAILVSSHILTELSDFCNAVGIMEKGKLRVSGGLEQVRAQMGSVRTLFIRTLASGSPEELQTRLRQVCSEFPEVRDFTDTTLPAQMKFLGNDDHAADLLKKLLSEGIAVCEFRLEKEDLEDLFWRVGAREVS